MKNEFLSKNSPYSVFIKYGYFEGVILTIHKLNEDIKLFSRPTEISSVILLTDEQIAGKIVSDLRVLCSKLDMTYNAMESVLVEAVEISRIIMHNAIPFIGKGDESTRTIQSIIDMGERMGIENPDLWYTIDFKPPFDIKVITESTSSYTPRKIIGSELPKFDKLVADITMLLEDFLSKFYEIISNDLIQLSEDVRNGLETSDNLTPFLPTEGWLMGIDEDMKMFNNIINAIYHNLALSDAVVTICLREMAERE